MNLEAARDTNKVYCLFPRVQLFRMRVGNCLTNIA